MNNITTNPKPETRNPKPKLSFWQIWNMSFGFLGIQFGFALQNANVSRIFESLGADISNIPILWLAAPVTGLIIQPIIGHWSDKTWNKLGRRKPFFLTGAILASSALLFMPNSPALWIAAGTLWIMDASINISMEPFRAFVGDMLPSEQRTLGFSMQSFFIGLGAVAGSALPYVLTNWFQVSNVPYENQVIPDTVRWAFYIGGFVFILSVLVTIFSTKEYSPEELENFETENKQILQEKVIDKNVSPSKFQKFGLLFSIFGLLIVAWVYYFKQDVQIYVLGGLFILVSILFFLTAFFRKKESKNGMTEIMTDLMNMPRTMGQLAVVQFFTWTALFAMWIYSTPAITQYHYNATDTKSAFYNEGANWVGVLFGAYSLFAALTAFLLPVLAKKISRKYTHLISLIIGGIGMISIIIFKDPKLLLISMFGVGIAWASILSMPYAMLTGALPPAKMGTYMGIFNFFIVLPQILAATILGSITKHIFHNHPIYTLVFGGCSLIIAGILTLIVQDNDDPIHKK
ncbi:putative sugar transporter [uncultured Paludibacter sp.]|uniref:Putative sugar transporter n=1 Tax=uncultured Paludibacter sp. TaxID=497635 RepID=A0A653ACH1_9BACT|nr:putative sugar transporter [uncultured Paludibacter sp.]